MSNLLDFGLAGDPFALVPTAKVTHWAGRAEVRDLLLDVAHSVRIDEIGLSEFVIIHGDWGAGKTHALRYLFTTVNETEAQDFRSLAIYMPKIKVGQKLSFQEVYKRIVQDLGMARFRDIGQGLKRRVDAAAQALSASLTPQEVHDIHERGGGIKPRVIEACPPEDQPMLRLLLDLADGDEDAFSFLVGNRALPRSSGFTHQISTDFDAAHVFGSLCRAITLPIGEQEPVYKAVHLLIDEAEDALQAKAAEQAELWGAIREIVNQVPYRMALLIAFTAEAAFLEAVMPEAVLERTTRRNIELQALDINEAKEFLRDHLAFHRPEGFNTPTPYYPFTEDAIDIVLEREPILVPRKLFRHLRQILNRAIKREDLAPGDEIDAGMAAEIIASIGI